MLTKEKERQKWLWEGATQSRIDSRAVRLGFTLVCACDWDLYISQPDTPDTPSLEGGCTLQSTTPRLGSLQGSNAQQNILSLPKLMTTFAHYVQSLIACRVNVAEQYILKGPPFVVCYDSHIISHVKVQIRFGCFWFGYLYNFRTF